MSAAILSIGAASTSTSYVLSSVTPSAAANAGNAGAVRTVSATTKTKTTLKTSSERGTSSASGMVASTIGTAPLRPAKDRNACSGMGTRKGTLHTTTLIGR